MYKLTKINDLCLEWANNHHGFSKYVFMLATFVLNPLLLTHAPFCSTFQIFCLSLPNNLYNH